MFHKNNDEKLGKFEARADEGIILGYSSRKKGYKCCYKRLRKIVEFIDVVIPQPLHSFVPIFFSHATNGMTYSLFFLAHKK